MSAEPQSPAIPPLTQFDFHRRILEMTGVVLVVFTSPSCGACRHIKQVLRQVHRQNPAWRVFEVDVERDPGLGNEFEVFHLPTIFLFHNGAYHCQLMAEASPGAIARAVPAALQQPAQEAP